MDAPNGYIRNVEFRASEDEGTALAVSATREGFERVTGTIDIQPLPPCELSMTLDGDNKARFYADGHEVTCEAWMAAFHQSRIVEAADNAVTSGTIGKAETAKRMASALPDV